MNNSSVSVEDEISSPFLILSVNISMGVVVLAFLCHMTAVFTLLRPTMRKKIMTPFMVNISSISLTLASCGYSVTLGTNFLRETENNTKVVFRCSWVAYVDLLCTWTYSSTLCAMNVVSKIVVDRCSRGASQPISRKSNNILLLVSWLYPFVMSGIPFLAGNLFRLSASKLTCQLHWPSKQNGHYLYNSFASIAVFLLPMVICFAMQYLCSRIWKRIPDIRDASIRHRLVYRRKLNRMVVALTFFFFFSHLPKHVTNVVAMAMGYYTISPKTAFVLELFAQTNVVCSPFIYLLLNSRYRTTLKELITGPTAQRGQTANQRGGNFQRTAPHAQQRRKQSRSSNRRVMFSNRVESSPRIANLCPSSSSTNASSSGKHTGLATKDSGISTSGTDGPSLADASSHEQQKSTRMCEDSSEQTCAHSQAHSNLKTATADSKMDPGLEIQSETNFRDDSVNP